MSEWRINKWEGKRRTWTKGRYYTCTWLRISGHRIQTRQRVVYGYLPKDDSYDEGFYECTRLKSEWMFTTPPSRKKKKRQKFLAADPLSGSADRSTGTLPVKSIICNSAHDNLSSMSFLLSFSLPLAARLPQLWNPTRFKKPRPLPFGNRLYDYLSVKTPTTEAH